MEEKTKRVNVMRSRSIVFTAPCVAELVEKEIAQPTVNEVQVQMAVSTISSGTERANLIGDPNVSWASKPCVSFPRGGGGYSSAGVVTAVGEGVTELKVGDRVAMSWSHHGQLVNLDQKNVYKLPDDVSFQDAAMFHIGVFPLAAIRKCRLEIGEAAIVMGMGVLGLVAVQLLKAAGAVPVIAVDPMPEKREKALTIGADYALDPMAPDFAETVKDLTGGGAKVGIEVTGIGAGLDGVLDCMARFGRVALLGCTRNKEFSIDYYRKVHGPGITLVGAHTQARPETESSGGWWTQRDDVLALLKLHQMGRLKLGDLVDETDSFEEAPEIYDRLAKDKAFPVVQFHWHLDDDF